jgi:hypothetical protein
MIGKIALDAGELVPFQPVPANSFENALSEFAADAWTVIWSK